MLLSRREKIVGAALIESESDEFLAKLVQKLTSLMGLGPRPLISSTNSLITR